MYICCDAKAKAFRDHSPPPNATVKKDIESKAKGLTSPLQEPKLHRSIISAMGGWTSTATVKMIGDVHFKMIMFHARTIMMPSSNRQL